MFVDGALDCVEIFDGSDASDVSEQFASGFAYRVENFVARDKLESQDEGVALAVGERADMCGELGTPPG